MSNVYVHFSLISFPARYSVVNFQLESHSLRFREVMCYTVPYSLPPEPSAKERKISMSDFIPKPTVKTICKDSRYNFKLVIYAYRQLSASEANFVYQQYLSKMHLKHPPRNKTVIVKKFLEWFLSKLQWNVSLPAPHVAICNRRFRGVSQSLSSPNPVLCTIKFSSSANLKSRLFLFLISLFRNPVLFPSPPILLSMYKTTVLITSYSRKYSIGTSKYFATLLAFLLPFSPSWPILNAQAPARAEYIRKENSNHVEIWKSNRAVIY